MRSDRKHTGFIFFLAGLLSLVMGCRQPGPVPQGSPAASLQGDLIIFHAGSLSVPFKVMADSFMKQHPGVRVMLEAAGSVASVRKITDLGRNPDILASADAFIIDRFLVPDYADWNLPFATNELVIAYHPRSRKHEVLTASNWTQLLLDPSITYGRSDPNSDPCGYRTLMMLQLAEAHYQQPGLTEAFSSRHRQHIRPKEVDLLALLESGNLDYIFIYRSVAQQHDLPFLELPPQINLGDPLQADRYLRAQVKIPGNAPGEWVDLSGAPTVYGICLLRDAPHRETAEAFLRFLVSPENGLDIISRLGQQPYPGDLAARLDSLLSVDHP